MKGVNLKRRSLIGRIGQFPFLLLLHWYESRNFTFAFRAAMLLFGPYRKYLMRQKEGGKMLIRKCDLCGVNEDSVEVIKVISKNYWPRDPNKFDSDLCYRCLCKVYEEILYNQEEYTDKHGCLRLSKFVLEAAFRNLREKK